jgi:hypothetical protein
MITPVFLFTIFVLGIYRDCVGPGMKTPSHVHNLSPLRESEL